MSGYLRIPKRELDEKLREIRALTTPSQPASRVKCLKRSCTTMVVPPRQLCRVHFDRAVQILKEDA